MDEIVLLKIQKKKKKKKKKKRERKTMNEFVLTTSYFSFSKFTIKTLYLFQKTFILVDFGITFLFHFILINNESTHYLL